MSSVYVGIPTYNGQIHHKTMKGLLQTAVMCGKHSVSFSVDVVPHDAFIGKARNTLAHRFLESGFEELVFVDADVGFGGVDLAALCLADADIVCGLYLMKSKKRQFPAAMVLDSEACPVPHPKDPGLLKLQYGPAGFMKIRRNVFEKMLEKYPDDWYGEDKKIGLKDNPDDFEVERIQVHDFFPFGRFGHDFTGEDIKFCERARDCGFDIWALQGLQLTHYGEAGWEATWRVTHPDGTQQKATDISQAA